LFKALLNSSIYCESLITPEIITNSLKIRNNYFAKLNTATMHKYLISIFKSINVCEPHISAPFLWKTIVKKSFLYKKLIFVVFYLTVNQTICAPRNACVFVVSNDNFIYYSPKNFVICFFFLFKQVKLLDINVRNQQIITPTECVVLLPIIVFAKLFYPYCLVVLPPSLV